MEQEASTIRVGDNRDIDTGWANPPKLSDLKLDYIEAQSHHSSHVNQVNTWLDNMYILGAAKPKFRKGRSSVVPKLIRKQAEWRYAGLSEAFLSTEDIFTTEPHTAEDRQASYQSGLILNNQFNTQIDKVTFIDEFVRAGVNEGSMLVRVGWDFEEEEIEVDNLIPTPVTEPFKQSLIEQGAKMLMEDPEAAQQLPPELMEIVQLSLEMQAMVEMKVDPDQPTRKEMKTILNQPTLEVCDYATAIVDPTCKGKIDKAQFVIWEFETSKGELKRDGRYFNLDKINVEHNSTNNNATNVHDEDIGSFNFTDDPRKKFKAFEYWGYWDIHGTGIPTAFLATWVGDTMIRMEESPYPDNKLPFVLIPYMPRRKNVYGEPDGELLIDNQKIAGAVTRGMIDIMGRSAAGQIGYRKDAFDITNLRKFEAGKDYAYNAHINPRDAFHTHVYPEIPSSAPFMLALQNNDAESMTGVKAFHEGITGEGLGKSATAARSAIDAAGKRELAILRRLAKGMTDIARKIIAMNNVFLSEQEIVRITNEEFVTIDRNDLEGNFDIKLRISTAESDNAKAQELAFMLQTTGPNSDPGEVRMIRAEIARLRKMPELAKRIEEYEPQPDPMQVKRQELELKKLEAEIEEIQSKTIENLAEADLDTAQAKKARSDADKTDLDYVEQESGTKQERDKELQGEQAAANERLEEKKAKLSTNGDNSSKSKSSPNKE